MKNKKRFAIALFIPNMSGGGAERFAINLAQGLLEEGIEVHLIAVKMEGDMVCNIPEGVIKVDLNSPTYLKAMPGLIRYLNSSKLEAIIPIMPRANMMALLAKSLSSSNTRVIVTEHSNPSRGQTYGGMLKGIIVPFLNRRLYPKAAAIVAVSDGVAGALADYLNLPRKSITTIYNPIDVKPFVSSQEHIHPWLRHKSTPVVVSAGRLVEAKNQALLIDAFAKVVQEGSDARLIIFGEGPLRSELASQVNRLGLADKVSLPGFTSAVRAQMRRADLFVLSSQWEGFGNVVVEALADNLPVVSTDCDYGPREILDYGRLGTLVPLRDPNAMGMAIIHALSHPTPVCEAEFFDKFTVQHAARKYLNLI